MEKLAAISNKFPGSSIQQIKGQVSKELGDYDRTRFYEVIVEERGFCCPKCGVFQYYIIYPISHPSDGAIRIDCDCNEVYFWSRKLEKFFHEATRAELNPDEHFALFDKFPALQLKTPEITK